MWSQKPIVRTVPSTRVLEDGFGLWDSGVASMAKGPKGPMARKGSHCRLHSWEDIQASRSGPGAFC